MIRVLRVARSSAVKARAVAITQLKAVIKSAPDELRSELRDLDGATDVGGQLLATIGDNPDRIHSSAAFAHLCGVAPIPASSGKTNRHRLNRGGDRNANCALYRVAMSRLRYDPRTRLYRDRLLATGKTNKDTIRILKRAIARDVYQAIKTDLTTTPIQT